MSESGDLPSLSAVVLNYNGGDMVLECIESLLNQDISLVEVVCVDNASADGSDRAIEERFGDEVRLVKLPGNSGYAGGMNRGIDATGSELVALLNLDVVLERSYLRLCAEALSRDTTVGGATGKLYRPGHIEPRTLDTTGHIVYRNRRAVDRGEREPDSGQYDGDRSLFSVCGAAPVYRRSMLDDVALGGQYFDEEFFAYFEDFDLSWRAQLRGWKFIYVPEATGTHHRGGTGGKASTFILACNHRNRWLVMLHNDHPASFLKHLGGIAYTEVRATLHMLSLRPAALLAAWGQFLKLLPSQLGKRRQIQSSRTVVWQALEPSFERYDYSVRAFLRRARQRAAVR